MKRNSLRSYLLGGTLAFLLSFATVACLVTGLRLNTELLPLALFGGVLTAILGLLLYQRRGGWYALGACMIALALLLPSEGYREQFSSMLSAIFYYYQQAYGLALPESLTASTALPHLLPLLTIQTFVSILCCWTLVRRYPAILVVFVSILPLSLCFVVTDTVPELWCILLWLFTLILILLTHPVRLRDDPQGIQLTKVLALPLALFLVVLSVLVPQQGYQIPQLPFTDFDSLWAWSAQYLPFLDTTYDGELVVSFAGTMPDHLELDTLPERTPSTTAVMEVRTNFQGSIYLRGRDYDRYDGKTWHSDPQRQETGLLTTTDTDTLGNVKIRLLGDHGQLYLPYYPSEDMTFSGGMVRNEDDVTEYRVSCVTVSPGQSYQPNTQIPDSRYLELPESTRTAAQQILDSIHTPMPLDTTDAAATIRDYVSSIATYDMATGPMPSDREDFAIWFLTESDTGYCVHFATAATVLLRAAGIPARYVEGYAVDVRTGQTVTVRQEAAHAWVEYYEEGIGWMILEATPGTQTVPPVTEPDPTTEPTDPSTEPTTEPTEPSTTEPTEPSTTEPSVTDPTTEPTEPTVTEPSITEPSETLPATEPSTAPANDPPATKSTPTWVWRTLIVLAATVLAVLLVIGQWILRRRYKERQMHRGKVNHQALARYREAARLARLTKAEIPHDLHALAEKAGFSQHKLTPQELSQFDAFLQDRIQAMQARSFFHRLAYRLIWAAY